MKTEHKKNLGEDLLFCFSLITVIKKNQPLSIKESTNVIPVTINGVTSVEGSEYAYHKVQSDAQQKQGLKIVIVGDTVMPDAVWET
jgi:hypothetical protein